MDMRKYNNILEKLQKAVESNGCGIGLWFGQRAWERAEKAGETFQEYFEDIVERNTTSQTS
jgi:hypothetical protein